MFPVSISATHAASSPPTTSAVAPAPNSTTSTSRPGRLRGLSYLRHYTHHHSSSSRAAPTAVVTTTTASTSHQPASPTAPVSPSASPSSPPAPASPRQQRRATSPLNNTESNSWIPTVSGISGLSRVATVPAAELDTSSVHASNVSAAPDSDGNQAIRSIDAALSHDEASHMDLNAPAKAPSFSIRFTPHIDHRSTRQSLQFSPIERTLKIPDERIKVGRFNERDVRLANPPVGFKSKVVSRRHCEFWCENGQWFVKDVKSSSGTFLNHIRLSAPGMESKPYPLQDGDVLQLGIDFKGGEEQIYRCVKIRVELNRAWQKALNNFNLSAHRRLRSLAKGKDSDTCNSNTSECSICLLAVAPCQSLFVAPCSHVWHYKCIRPLIEKEYPCFLCPNCRAVADLDRDIDEDELTSELWEMIPEHDADAPLDPDHAEVQSQDTTNVATAGTVGASEPTTALTAVTAAADTSNRITVTTTTTTTTTASQTTRPTLPAPPPPRPTVDMSTSPAQPSPAATSQPISTPPSQTTQWRRRWNMSTQATSTNDDHDSSHTTEDSGNSSAGEMNGEGPMTPMNDAGPFLLDGNDGRVRGSQRRDTLFLPLGNLPPGSLSTPSAAAVDT
ncbi:hypothetical protein EX30DRAFT_54633 [Ascodesmis nigricans]|uniref:SMAD/FHA domain-containing protein n=1 Tax=Ascodesmis nigricans TaxID=341454 RepID=A0A4S2MVM8_9PEZI|nr:hypothetical protein EX30DRAFT_54633 [Ascodesmis nigricans]